jgi:hypothetical protein
MAEVLTRLFVEILKYPTEKEKIFHLKAWDFSAGECLKGIPTQIRWSPLAGTSGHTSLRRRSRRDGRALGNSAVSSTSSWPAGSRDSLYSA